MVLDFTRLTEETMTYEDYLLHLFYLIDSELKALNLPPLRTRGPAPRLHDSEVITMELAGEFFGIDTDKGIWQYFRRHHGGEFPNLLRTDRTRFCRQAADLWRVKQLLLQRVLNRLPLTDPANGDASPLWLIDTYASSRSTGRGGRLLRSSSAQPAGSRPKASASSTRVSQWPARYCARRSSTRMPSRRSLSESESQIVCSRGASASTPATRAIATWATPAGTLQPVPRATIRMPSPSIS